MQIRRFNGKWESACRSVNEPQTVWIAHGVSTYTPIDRELPSSTSFNMASDDIECNI
jgi:hypothetical protein